LPAFLRQRFELEQHCLTEDFGLFSRDQGIWSGQEFQCQEVLPFGQVGQGHTVFLQVEQRTQALAGVVIQRRQAYLLGTFC
jgi:hypothetical protein